MPRLLSILILLSLFAPARLRAATAADRAFQAAAKAFQDGFYQRAETQFDKFIKDFPESPKQPEAVLFEAEARIQQTNYPGAIELLTPHLSASGSFKDQYVFWLGEANNRKGDYAAATNFYGKLIQEFPASDRALASAVRYAAVLGNLQQWKQEIEFLRATNNIYQVAARTNSADEWVLRGTLLLAEAELAMKDYAAADNLLQPLGKVAMPGALAWQRQYLACRLQIAQGRNEDALLGTQNLMSRATNAAQPELRARTESLRGTILENLGRADEAIAAYTNNLAPGVAIEFQQTAIQSITRLQVAAGKLPAATKLVEDFVAANPASQHSDAILLTLGEMYLRQSLENSSTNAAASTNMARAISAFQELTNKFPASPYVGKSQLDLGWCFWYLEKLPESEAAFQSAVAKLPVTATGDVAVAYFKLGDTCFRQGKLSAAISNYNAVIDRCFTSDLAELRTNLCEPALYQVVRAGISSGDLNSASNAFSRLLVSYPSGFHADQAILLLGQNRNNTGNPASARKLFQDYLKTAPQSALRPEVELALARTYERELAWTNAVHEYDGWLAAYTNNPAQPRAEYCRAWALFQAGDETNAFINFTNFIARFPTNEFAAQAQWWVADHYADSGNNLEAERNYELLSHRPTASVEEQGQAKMSAGRAAIKRQAWNDASDYFSKLASNTNCPEDLRAQALFAYGDVLMVRDGVTNKMDDFKEAMTVFTRIGELFPSNRLAVLALGEKAACLIQWAQLTHDPGALTNALASFQTIVADTNCDVAARSAARVGRAVVLEKIAAGKAGIERTALLQDALNGCLDVLYGAGEGQSDPFWVKRAGLEACVLADALGRPAQVVNVYRRLEELLPPMKPWLEKQILKIESKAVTGERAGQ
jgi:TolA-binding protein